MALTERRPIVALDILTTATRTRRLELLAARHEDLHLRRDHDLAENIVTCLRNPGSPPGVKGSALHRPSTA